MASARKRGNGYEIKVYCGLRPDALGRIDKYEMWYPEPGMTPKQIEKALEKEKPRFEEEIKHGNTYNSKMKFCELVELWRNDYATRIVVCYAKEYSEGVIMIAVKENAEYQVGFELSQMVGQVRWLRDQFDKEAEIEKAEVISRLDDVLDKLSKIHSMMTEK